MQIARLQFIPVLAIVFKWSNKLWNVATSVWLKFLGVLARYILVPMAKVLLAMAPISGLWIGDRSAS